MPKLTFSDSSTSRMSGYSALGSPETEEEPTSTKQGLEPKTSLSGKEGTVLFKRDALEAEDVINEDSFREGIANRSVEEDVLGSCEEEERKMAAAAADREKGGGVDILEGRKKNTILIGAAGAAVAFVVILLIGLGIYGGSGEEPICEYHSVVQAPGRQSCQEFGGFIPFIHLNLPIFSRLLTSSTPFLLKLSLNVCSTHFKMFTFFQPVTSFSSLVAFMLHTSRPARRRWTSPWSPKPACLQLHSISQSGTTPLPPTVVTP